MVSQREVSQRLAKTCIHLWSVNSFTLVQFFFFLTLFQMTSISVSSSLEKESDGAVC